MGPKKRMRITLNILILMVIPNALRGLPISPLTSSCITLPPHSLLASHARLLAHRRLASASGPLHLLFLLPGCSSSRNPQGSLPHLFLALLSCHLIRISCCDHHRQAPAVPVLWPWGEMGGRGAGGQKNTQGGGSGGVAKGGQ